MIYVTFGQAHRHEIDGVVFDKDCVAVINSDNREAAFDIFGMKYCFTYTRKEDVEIGYYPRGFIEVK